MEIVKRKGETSNITELRHSDISAINGQLGGTYVFIALFSGYKYLKTYNIDFIIIIILCGFHFIFGKIIYKISKFDKRRNGSK
ncbi:MAG: hypothetical protein IPL23_16250 [Saprospiraceae bacterium]|nr:hypothetical protein [Saprospiraceae bacterium]